MSKIKMLNNCVLVMSDDSQLTLTKSQTGGVDAVVGAATVGASSTSERVAASPASNVSNEWILGALQDVGCDEENIAKILDHLKLGE